MEVNKESCKDESDTSIRPPVCDWLKDANIFNYKLENVPISLITDRVDAIVLYFSMLNADRFGIIHKFSEIYINTKYINLPVEVINIPMDDNTVDMWKSYEEQPHWCTLKHGDPLISILQYRYGITSVPHLLVMSPDGTIISSHGILDLDVYGRNAFIAWLSTPVFNIKRLNKDLSLFDVSIGTMKKCQYRRKFTDIIITDIPKPTNNPVSDVSLS